MVASISNSTSNSTVSNWADIKKTDLQNALSKAGGAGNGDGAVNVDDTFSALDGDSDGKVTKSELTAAMTKLSDQLNAQFDAARVGRGGPLPDGPPPEGQEGADGASGTGAVNGTGGVGGMAGAGGPHGPHGGGRAGGGGGGDSTDGTSSTNSTSGTSADYIAAADTDGDGTVSDAEQAAYDKKAASGQADGGTTRQAAHQKDPMRELAHALHLLKAYAETGGGSDASAASTASASASTTAAGGVSVEA
jgi:hypothetical protein